MNEHPSIAVIAPNWLGDAVMSLPLVGTISGASNVVLSVIAPEATARVYWGLPGVAELVVLPKRDGTRGIRTRAKYLRRTRPDAVVVLPPSLSAAVGPWLARVPFRVGYRSDGRDGLLTDALDGTGFRSVHLSKNYVRLGDVAMKRLGIDSADAAAAPAVQVGASDHAELDRLFEPATTGTPYVVVVPGATYGPAKSWPARATVTSAHNS